MEAVVADSHREACMAYLWARIRSAWDEGDGEQAHHLHTMYTNLEVMTDAEYLEAVTCDCLDCDCAH